MTRTHFTARSRLDTWAHASRVQSDEVCYGLLLSDMAGGVGAGNHSGSDRALARGRTDEGGRGLELNVNGIERLGALDAILYTRPAGRNIIDFAIEEIEHLRELVNGTIDRNSALASENARLRGLLREVFLGPSQFPDWFVKRAREALGENDIPYCASCGKQKERCDGC